MIFDHLHNADERAKAAPGCPFTASVDTAELAVNDPDRCIVEARWFTLGESDRPADVAVTVRGCRAWTGLRRALQAGLDERDGRFVVCVLAGQDDRDSSTSKSRSAYSRCSHSSLRMACRHRRTAKL